MLVIQAFIAEYCPPLAAKSNALHVEPTRFSSQNCLIVSVLSVFEPSPVFRWLSRSRYLHGCDTWKTQQTIISRSYSIKYGICLLRLTLSRITGLACSSDPVKWEQQSEGKYMRVREVRAHLINTGLGSVFRVICTRNAGTGFLLT